MVAENERVNRLNDKVIETSTLLNVAQHDINALAEVHRKDVIELKDADDRIVLKTNKHETEFKIIKAIITIIGSLILGVAYLIDWIIEHIDIIKNITK